MGRHGCPVQILQDMQHVAAQLKHFLLRAAAAVAATAMSHAALMQQEFGAHAQRLLLVLTLARYWGCHGSIVQQYVAVPCSSI
jgi:hypothetical protein